MMGIINDEGRMMKDEGRWTDDGGRWTDEESGKWQVVNDESQWMVDNDQ